VTRFARILVVLDGQPEGQRALEHALALAVPLRARLDAVVVEGRLPALPATVAEVDEAKREKDAFFEQIARLAEDQSAEAGVECVAEIAAGPPADVILSRAREGGFDLVVVGYHRRLFGSTADRLCHHAPCPVLVVRGDR
jgi:nucleotide-binding universal stress UspA family protein